MTVKEQAEIMNRAYNIVGLLEGEAPDYFLIQRTIESSNVWFRIMFKIDNERPLLVWQCVFKHVGRAESDPNIKLGVQDGCEFACTRLDDFFKRIDQKMKTLKSRHVRVSKIDEENREDLLRKYRNHFLN